MKCLMKLLKLISKPHEKFLAPDDKTCNSYREIQQDVTMYQEFSIPYLHEAQHVLGNTPPIIRSLKLQWQPLIFHTWKVVGRVAGGRWILLWCTDPWTSRHVKFKVFSECFTQEKTSRCVTRIHRVCSVMSIDKVPSLLRYSLLWDITWRILLFIYRVSLFISDCLSLKTGPIGFTETSVNNFHSCTLLSNLLLVQIMHNQFALKH
jgi:hypothetical protein